MPRRLTVSPSHRLTVSLHLLRMLMLSLVALTITGCAPWATYPPIQGAAQIGRPEFEPVPAIMAEAIRFTYQRHGAAFGDEIVFNLPEGTPPNVYERVLARLGDETPARWMTPEDRYAIHIKSIRVRAMDSQVDVIYPRRDGHHEMIMLNMRQHFANRHKVTGSRLWRIYVAAPPAHYEPPPLNKLCEQPAIIASEIAPDEH